MPQNLQQATAASIYRNNVNQLNNFGSSRSGFTTADMFNTLENDVANFITRVKQNIQAENMIVTGEIDNIRIETNQNGINVLANEWLVYQDRGVQGSESSALAPNSPHKYSNKMPPAYVFKDFINRKNLQLRNQHRYDSGTTSQFRLLTNDEMVTMASWGMAKNIYKVGFKPREIYSKEIPQLVQDLTQSIVNFSTDMIQHSITNRHGQNVFNRP